MHRSKTLQHATCAQPDASSAPSSHIVPIHHSSGHLGLVRSQGSVHHTLQHHHSEHADADAGGVADEGRNMRQQKEGPSGGSISAAPASLVSRIPSVGLVEIGVVAALCMLFMR